MDTHFKIKNIHRYIYGDDPAFARICNDYRHNPDDPHSLFYGLRGGHTPATGARAYAEGSYMVPYKGYGNWYYPYAISDRWMECQSPIGNFDFKCA